MDEFESFDTKSFVGRLLGKGDWGGFMDKIKVGRGVPGAIELQSDSGCSPLREFYALAAVASLAACLALAWCSPSSCRICHA